MISIGLPVQWQVLLQNILGWKKSIIEVLKSVPKEKLVLGIPFYTRLWKTEDDELTSYALSMEKANEFIEENNMELEWDEKSGQYYGEVQIENVVYKSGLRTVIL